MTRIAATVLVLVIVGCAPPAPPATKTVRSTSLNNSIPDRVLKVLEYVDEHDEPPKGYEGGRHFGNFEVLLPQVDLKGRRIRYREWDVHPLGQRGGRGPERLVTGSDDSAYYTADHYASFQTIRSP